MLRSKPKFYNKLILYFSIILIICVLGLSIILYYFSSNAINEEINNANVNSLSYIVKNMEISLKSIDFLSSQIAIDPDITYFARNDFSDDYMKLYTLTGNMDSHRVTNSLVQSMYIYFKSKDSIITSPDGKVMIDTYNDKNWIQKLSFKSQTEWMFNCKISISGSNEETVEVLTYVRYLPVGSIKPEGALLININVEELHKLYQRSDERSSGIIVFNENNDKIFSTVDSGIDIYAVLQCVGDMKKKSDYSQTVINGKSYAIAYTIGSNGWKYLMMTPTLELMAMSNIFKKIILLGTLFILLVGAMLSFVFSRRLYNPVKSLMRRFKLEYEPDEYETIECKKIDTLSRKRHLINKHNIVDEFGIIENSVNTLIIKTICLKKSPADQ